MTKSTPEKILHNYQKDQITRERAIETLMDFIQSAPSEEVRFSAFESLQKFPMEGDLSSIFENLAISDENPLIRAEALRILISNDQSKGGEIALVLAKKDPSKRVLITLVELISDEMIGEKRDEVIICFRRFYS